MSAKAGTRSPTLRSPRSSAASLTPPPADPHETWHREPASPLHASSLPHTWKYVDTPHPERGFAVMPDARFKASLYALFFLSITVLSLFMAITTGQETILSDRTGIRVCILFKTWRHVPPLSTCLLPVIVGSVSAALGIGLGVYQTYRAYRIARRDPLAMTLPTLVPKPPGTKHRGSLSGLLGDQAPADARWVPSHTVYLRVPRLSLPRTYGSLVILLSIVMTAVALHASSSLTRGIQTVCLDVQSRGYTCERVLRLWSNLSYNRLLAASFAGWCLSSAWLLTAGLLWCDWVRGDL
ncbi:hypothetical protein CXG81DRAFT_26080 [Caulochytrium protostelioides]|uniref:Uncharacterized protein n=1 Tax=Caulochytrium protostelioides TaxID=1555241 RepID=A0A4V1IUN9_9FUNG|nr:hypothetical protein CXG81DRAFT_26080 [Caulochytrium protostelioides]|eukprot:RKP01219.1 hypothetical protein CXG81DRAFT_26080 [Caulochytrium protostelioides]